MYVVFRCNPWIDNARLAIRSGDALIKNIIERHPKQIPREIPHGNLYRKRSSRG